MSGQRRASLYGSWLCTLAVQRHRLQEAGRYCSLRVCLPAWKVLTREWIGNRPPRPEVQVPLPLLLAYAEPIPAGVRVLSAQLGTETFTKSIEVSDTDASGAGDSPTLSEIDAGTATHSASSEEQDVDLGAPPELALGTETFTEVRAEQTDSDEPRRGSALWEATLL